MKRMAYFVLAWFCLGMGVLGIFLPLLPTTPLMLAAAFCFAKSSPRFYTWMTQNKYLNCYLKNYRSGCGVPAKIIWRSLIYLWVGLGLSACFWDDYRYWLLLAVVGAAVSTHLLMLKRVNEKA